METELLQKLGRKELTKAHLFQIVEKDFGLLPQILEGTLSPKASIRYGCGSVLMGLSEKYPERLYPYIDIFIELLDSEFRILTWNAMAIIANLTTVDTNHKFDSVFKKYYSYMKDEYMVTVANVVGNSAKIAIAKPYLTRRITKQLLKVQDLQITPHLTEECKLVIAEQAIKSFNTFDRQIENREQVIAFAKKYLNSSRKQLREEAQRLIKKLEPNVGGPEVI